MKWLLFSKQINKAIERIHCNVHLKAHCIVHVEKSAKGPQMMPTMMLNDNT